jgi:hypothetical protein
MSSENSTSSNALKKWLAGIVSSIIVFWLTVPLASYFSEKWRQSPDPQGGLWDITIEGNQQLDGEGFVEKKNVNIGQEWSLTLTGDHVSGKLRKSESNNLSQVCGEGYIDGEMSNDELLLTLTLTGDCCPTSQSVYKLKFSDATNFWGTMEPKHNPQIGCVLWSGNVKGKRQSNE